MAENTDEEQLDPKGSILPENLPDENAPAADTDAIIPNQDTEDMEVHHHAHDPAAPHHKKTWKSYFWEFLMLFLAVFCGYLAESYHTHSVNKDIEKRNMELVVDNLRDDVVKFKTNISFHEQKVKVLDTLISFRNIENADTLNSREFGFLFSKSIYNPVFVSNTAAIDQMKSSGSLRLVKNKKVLESIFKYVAMSNLLSADRDRLDKGDELWIENASAFLDMQYLAGSRGVKFLQGNPLKSQNNLASQQVIYQFFNRAIIRKSILEVLLLPRMHAQQKNAEDLIELLEKEYQIKSNAK